MSVNIVYQYYHLLSNAIYLVAGLELPGNVSQNVARNAKCDKVVVWKLKFIFPFSWEYLGIIIPTDELIFFRG